MRAMSPGWERTVAGRATSLSRLGLGTLQFPLLGQEAVDRLVAKALDLGVWVFDTAVRYGPAEEMLGRALSSIPAGRSPGPVVCAKTHARTAAAAEADLLRSVKLAGRARVGIYMLHDLRWGEDYGAVLGPNGALGVMLRRKGLGDIGGVGLSTHRPETALKAATELPLDALMLPVNVIDGPAFAPAIAEARRRGLAVLGMKALAGGALAPAAAALGAALTPEVDCLFVGVRSEGELEEDVAVAREAVRVEVEGMGREAATNAAGGGPARAGERDRGRTELDQAVTALGRGFCRGCGYCLPCPEEIPIPEVLRLWRYVTIYHSGDIGGFGYRRLGRRADACTGCGVCEDRCSYGLPVRQLLKSAHFDLTVGVAMGKGQ
jgi:predicted aldo/keto reductase-like oxidoreductase